MRTRLPSRERLRTLRQPTVESGNSARFRRAGGDSDPGRGITRLAGSNAGGSDFHSETSHDEGEGQRAQRRPCVCVEYHGQMAGDTGDAGGDASMCSYRRSTGCFPIPSASSRQFSSVGGDKAPEGSLAVRRCSGTSESPVEALPSLSPRTGPVAPCILRRRLIIVETLTALL